ncbi:MAG: DUF4924 family protein [Muribaculaceae bacterium]
MLIANAKRKENIAEYLLYMWQVEDILRAYKLNDDEVKRNIVERFQVESSTRKEIEYWYENLLEMMRNEHLAEGGHLQINKNVLIRLSDLHLELLKSNKFPDYVAEFYRTLPYIVELRSKAGEEKAGELETCFNALYGVLMLRLKGVEISPDTTVAIAQISKFLALLAKYFKKNEDRPLFEEDEVDE